MPTLPAMPLHLPEPRIHPGALIAPGARIYGDVEIADRVFVLFGVVMRAEMDRIAIGRQTNVQDNTVIHCDEGIPCLIGERVTIGHAAVVHGTNVADGCLIGIGARTLNGSVLGEGSWLAAGSVLTEGTEIPPWTLAVGTPARVVRDLTDDERARAARGVDHYQAFFDAYREIFS